MKIMKMLLALITVFSFIKCGSTKFQEKPPFKITSATYNQWVGGLPGVSGTNVKLAYTTTSNVTFDSIYFLNRIVKMELREEKGTKLIMGYFKNESPSVKPNNNLYAVAQRDIGNKPPVSSNFPFDLKENEAVISYKKGNKIKYFKIENLKKEKSMFFPSAPEH
jgi:hypothetical protein